ncbi:MAG: hypothetical protein WCE61_10140 [Candidatus Acidiferrum sp.]
MGTRRLLTIVIWLVVWSSSIKMGATHVMGVTGTGVLVTGGVCARGSHAERLKGSEAIRQTTARMEKETKLRGGQIGT